MYNVIKRKTYRLVELQGKDIEIITIESWVPRKAWFDDEWKSLWVLEGAIFVKISCPPMAAGEMKKNNKNVKYYQTY